LDRKAIMKKTTAWACCWWGLLIVALFNLGCDKGKGNPMEEEPVDGPVLTLSRIDVEVGVEPRQTTVEVFNTGEGELSWSLSEEANWLLVQEGEERSSVGGGLEGEGDAVLVISTSGSGLAVGIHDAVVRLVSNGGNREIYVRLVVGGRTSPSEGVFGPQYLAGLPGGGTMEFVWIPSGSFDMGSRQIEGGRQEDEGPQHKVELSVGIYMARFEITQAQWLEVMGESPWEGESFVQSAARNPAVYISWEDVQVFIRRLNERTEEVSFRLPSEAEWEYAARAGTTRRWSFGDDESLLWNHGWYVDNAWDEQMPWGQTVGRKTANPWGLYDMHGNVWEWVQDWYGESYYDASPLRDPPGPASGSERVARGGSFSNGVSFTRSAVRAKSAPSFRLRAYGARLVAVP
jgi:formylglycine-generating enzyme required for sulfatase activity